VWVQNVAVSVRALETRLDVAEAQGLAPDQQAAADGVRKLLRKAQDAAYGVDPSPARLSDWWGGILVEAAYQNLHAARAQIVDVLDDADLAAEIPVAIARTQSTMHRDDPRRINADGLTNQPLVQQRAMLRRAIEDGYDAMDRQHSRLRSFRNIILILALSIAALVLATIAAVSTNPSVMPMCFPASGVGDGGQTLQNCPTGSRVDGPSGGDILVVSLLGLLGGALAATVSIRNLRGTSTPYDVPVALAMLKVPLGAFTAILGIVAIRGDFVPGLSALDSQQQILAYALVLGYAQQVFTHALDRRAQTLLDALPGKDTASPSAVAVAVGPPAAPPPPPPPPAPPSGMVAVPAQAAAAPSITLPEPAAEPEYLPMPVDDDDQDTVQDDGSMVAPNVPVGDHR
jgi:hypothetical protein